jgi:glycerate dehydrogenase
MAWASVEARERLVNEVYKNIEAFLKGEDRNIII